MATAQRPTVPTAATLRVERRFAAPPERLFAAWSTAEGLSRWSAPGEMRPTAEVDLRVGGRYRIAMEGPDGSARADGGTDLVLVHEGLPDADSYARHAHGWDGCLDRLEREVG